MFFLAPRRVVQGARNTAEPLSVFIHNTLPLESTANYSTGPLRRPLGICLAAYIGKASQCIKMLDFSQIPVISWTDHFV